MLYSVNIIVHLAASTGVVSSVQNPRQDMDVNVIGTFNMLDAARQREISRFIFASSGASIGDCVPPIHELMVPSPVSPYGASKLTGESYCSAYHRTFGIETIVLRFGNVYGPWGGHKNSVVAKFIQQAMNGETLEIYGDGKQTRDFIYIDDLIRAIDLSTTAEGVGGDVFQIATNTETTVRDLVEELLPILTDAGIEGFELRHAASRLGEVKRNFSDISKASRVLGWKPRVGLDRGLAYTVKWFMENFKTGLAT